MSSFVETKAMEHLTKSPMEFVEYPLAALGPVGPAGGTASPAETPHLLPAQHPALRQPCLGLGRS